MISRKSIHMLKQIDTLGNYIGVIKLKLGEVYINKKNKSIIQIDSFATHMGEIDKPIIIYRCIGNHGGMIISCPSFNGYGSSEEIEAEYDLLIPQEDLDKYNSWDEVLDIVKDVR